MEENALRKPVIDLPRFPTDCLPDNLRDLVRAVSQNIQVTEDMIAVPLLSVVAGCCMNAFEVRIDNTYREPLCLYTITIARPSERKTAVLSILRKPIWEFTQQFNNVTHKAEIQMKKRKPLTVYVDDVTPEKLAKLMQENDGTMMLVSDEPDALRAITGMRYGKSVGNLSLVLQAWSAGNVLIQRISEDRRIEIERAVLSISIMAQPHFMDNLLSDDTLSERGFIQRLLYSYPSTLIGNRSFRKPDIPDVLLNEYKELVFTLLTENYKRQEVRQIRLGQDGYEEAERFFDELEPKLVDELKDIEGWAGKIFGQMIRIAGVLHCATWQNEADRHEIDRITILDATCIALYFIDHAKAVLTGSNDKVYNDIRYVWERILSLKKQEFTKTELNAVCKFRGRQLDDCLLYLTTASYIEERKEKSGSRTKTVYSVVDAAGIVYPPNPSDSYRNIET